MHNQNGFTTNQNTDSIDLAKRLVVLHFSVLFIVTNHLFSISCSSFRKVTCWPLNRAAEVGVWNVELLDGSFTYLADHHWLPQLVQGQTQGGEVRCGHLHLGLVARIQRFSDKQRYNDQKVHWKDHFLRIISEDSNVQQFNQQFLIALLNWSSHFLQGFFMTSERLPWHFEDSKLGCLDIFAHGGRCRHGGQSFALEDLKVSQKQIDQTWSRQIHNTIYIYIS